LAGSTNVVSLLIRLHSDLFAAWRGALAGRLSSIVAAVVLAIGTGASLTAATVAYGGLLRPLPFPESDRLVTLTQLYVRRR